KKSTSKSKPTAKDLQLRREKWRKATGVVFVLISLYLMIAFISYLYTWKYDQDKVLQFTWQSFFQANLNVENWLGRLRAYVSNAFFFWGFDMPSILFIALGLRLGIDLLTKRSLYPFLIMTRNAIAIMPFMSLLLEFFFRNSEFAW